MSAKPRKPKAPAATPQAPPPADPAPKTGADAYSGILPGTRTSAVAEYERRKAEEAAAEEAERKALAEREALLQTFDAGQLTEGELVEIPVPLLQHHPDNPRTWTAEDVDKMAEDMASFPDMLKKRPAIVVTDPATGLFTVLGGNLRLAAARKKGRKVLPCMLADSWTPEQREEFIFRDNLHRGTWDSDLVARKWDPGILASWGFDAPSDPRPRKTSTRTAKPYTKAHILLSYDPELAERVADLIEQARGIDGIDIQQSAN